MTLQEKTLFRGKRVGDGIWVEGNYVNCLMDVNAKESRHYIVEYPGEFHEIYTSTVGQYTGLKDRDGKMIFDGDIIEAQSEVVDLRGNETGRMHVTRYVVEWHEAYWAERKVYDSWGRFAPMRRRMNGNISSRFRKVIGNVDDNPELMQS